MKKVSFLPRAWLWGEEVPGTDLHPMTTGTSLGPKPPRGGRLDPPALEPLPPDPASSAGPASSWGPEGQSRHRQPNMGGHVALWKPPHRRALLSSSGLQGWDRDREGSRAAPGLVFPHRCPTRQLLTLLEGSPLQSGHRT